MKTIILIKSAVMAMLLIGFVQPAVAGDPTTKARTKQSTQSIGGESGGGGNPRQLKMTIVEAEARIKEIERELRAFVGASMIYSFEIIDKANRLSGRELNEGFIHYTKSSSGKVRIDPNFKGLDIDRAANFNDDVKRFKNPKLKKFMSMLNAKMPIDYDFLLAHSTKLSTVLDESEIVYELESVKLNMDWQGERNADAHKNRNFNINDYKNLIIMEQSYVMDYLLLDIRVQKEPCHYVDGKPQAASAIHFKRFTPICVSSEEMAMIPEDMFEQELKALLFHEIGHQYGFTQEDEADLEVFQEYYLKEIETKRADYREAVSRYSALASTIVSSAMSESFSDPLYTRGTLTNELNYRIGAIRTNFLSKSKVNRWEEGRARAVLRKLEEVEKDISDRKTLTWDELQGIVDNIRKVCDEAIQAVPNRY